jgi:V/A-type H+-transporting ATPase subunit B
MNIFAEGVGRGMERLGIEKTHGSLVFLGGGVDAAMDEVVQVIGADGAVRMGRVLSTGQDACVVLVYEGTGGLGLGDTRVRFRGRQLTMAVGEELMGRVFDGLGRPLDGLPPMRGEQRDISGAPICPTARAYPTGVIKTGFFAIDECAALIRGQKLPIFSESGMPQDEVAVHIAGRADADAIVFAAIGVGRDTAFFFRENIIESGNFGRSVVFLNLADDPPAARLATPRFALTAAEYLAFTQNKHVLVILTCMTAYCEALREVAGARGMRPGRGGFPGYMYSDLAGIYERAGVLKSSQGSITLMPILTMPAGDITHPIPDLTGYITAGQLVMSQGLHMRGVYPPICPLLSLSRLMSKGSGHELISRYAAACEERSLAAVTGAGDSELLRFANEFEDMLNYRA